LKVKNFVIGAIKKAISEAKRQKSAMKNGLQRFPTGHKQEA